MNRRSIPIALVALCAQAAGCPHGAPEPVTPYDLPVKTSGGIEESQSTAAVPLTLAVEAVDTPDDATLAGAVEDAIAFGHYATLSGCEAESAGWETGFSAGTIGIGFVLEQDGTTEDVSLVLSTGGPSESFTSCLVDAVRAMALEGVDLEGPASFHLMLRYGQ